jgi:hypothetical protein|tara:strand:- start:48120 stop:48434 length:315 start_codon:yes stop_codon:yes gene_type:complete
MSFMGFKGTIGKKLTCYMRYVTWNMLNTPMIPYFHKYTKHVENIHKIEQIRILQALSSDKMNGLMIAGELDLDAIYPANQFVKILEYPEHLSAKRCYNFVPKSC